jgi:hypothetical protein
MTTPVTRLGDPTLSFIFARGDKVAKLRDDGTPDPQFRGQVMDGTCVVESAGDSYTYEVQRDDGSYFTATERELTKLFEPQGP